MPTQQLIDIIIKAQDQASSTANKVDQSMQKIGQTGNLLGKIPGFNTLSTKLSGVGQTIKGKLSPYLDSARSKLQNLSKGASGFGAVLGPLKGALSMTVGMIGYDLVNGLVQAARASINAASQLDYFGKRLKMTGSESAAFRKQVDGLQKEFRKVDMTAVGATAEEMAVKFNLPKKSLGDLTRMTAVMSSTFVKEGRSQEDAILAVSDALDGQFKRLQEIGITQDTLKANGWNGNLEDQDSLIKALNKSMQEMGYEQTAKDITTLDEAWGALTIAGGQLLQKVLVPITPVLIQMIDGLLKVADAVGAMISAFGGMPDWAKVGAAVAAVGLAFVGLSTAISLGMIPALTEFVAGMAAATLAALEFAAAMLANPLTWVVIALAAIAVAIYEVGKAFGWWTSVNSMLAAIWAGINRLWSAFITHPDVQAILGVMTQAWNWLSSAVGSAISWVMSFFTVNTNGNFDIIRALINTIGAAWRSATLPIRIVITVIKLLWTTMLSVYNKIRTAVNNIRKLFSALPGGIRGAISGLVGILTAPFHSAYGTIKGVVNSIKTAAHSITNINLGGLTNKLTAPFQRAYSSIVGWAKKTYSNAQSWYNRITARGGSGGSYGFDLEGMLAELGKSSAPSVYTGSNESLTLDHNINFSFDFTNLPEGTSEETLVAMLRSAITDRSVINSLVNSPDFQSLDGKVKDRLLLKGNRARGV